MAAPASDPVLDFYRSLAEAMSRAGRLGGREVVNVVQSMLALCAELDNGRGRRRRRQALRHLAAGMIARNADDGGLRLHYLRVAVSESWRTVLSPPQLSWSVRLLFRRGLIRAVRRILATIGFAPRASVPAAVRAMVTAGCESGLRPGRRGEMDRGCETEP